MSILPWIQYVQTPYIKISNLKIDGETQSLRDEWREERLSNPGENFSLSNFEIFAPIFDCRMYARYPTTGGFGGGRGRGRGRGDWSGSPSASYGDGYNNGYRNPRHKRFSDKYEGYNREAIGRSEAPPPLDKEVSEGTNNSLHP